MPMLPSQTLVLSDGAGLPFGSLRLAPAEDAAKGECIFDVRLTNPEQGLRNEVRWLQKRGFHKAGEHRFSVDKEGAVTVVLADFRVVLDPQAEGHLRTRPPAPLVTATWKLDPAE